MRLYLLLSGFGSCRFLLDLRNERGLLCLIDNAQFLLTHLKVQYLSLELIFEQKSNPS